MYKKRHVTVSYDVEWTDQFQTIRRQKYQKIRSITQPQSLIITPSSQHQLQTTPPLFPLIILTMVFLNVKK